jgi:hypothetical protein
VIEDAIMQSLDQALTAREKEVILKIQKATNACIDVSIDIAGIEAALGQSDSIVGKIFFKHFTFRSVFDICESWTIR